MGMDRRVKVGETKFNWQAFADLLGARSLPVQLRMIDGQLSFPDETPPEDWRELRIGCAPGMITLRRDAGVIMVVAWGNADAELQRAWNAVASAVAEVTGGRVEGEPS